MRILVDESLPTELAGELGQPFVKTVAQVGLKGLENGDLLRRAESLGFAVLITADQNMEFQQDLAGYALAFIVLRARSNRMELLRPLIPGSSRRWRFSAWSSDPTRQLSARDIPP